MRRERVLSFFIILCCLYGALRQAAPGVIVASDDFELGSHPSGDRAIASGIALRFHTRDASTAVTAGIISDATFGSQALAVSDLNAPAATSKPIIGLLPMTLQLTSVNDFISLSFQFHFTNAAAVTSNAANFRFGIFSSAETPVTSDSQLTSDNDRGYYVQVGSGTTAPTPSNTFYNEGGTILPILASTDRQSITASSSGAVINNNNVHSAIFTLTRVSASAISLSLVIDGAAAITGTDATVNLRTSFDEIAFSNGFQNPNLNYAIDNVTISSNIPEAGTASAICLGAALAGTPRRRRPQRSS